MNKLRHGLRVLVLEDEMLVMMMIEDMLGDLGCTSTSAATIPKALLLVAEQPFDAGMLDMNLNGKQSQPVAEALSGRGVPFFYVTGNTGPTIMSGYPERAVLRKPFKFQELDEMLTGLIARG